MGNKISYSSGTLRRDFLPTNLKLGLTYTMEFDPYNRLMLGAEINKLLVPTPPIYEKIPISELYMMPQINPL